MVYKKYIKDDEMISHFCNILCNLIGKNEWRDIKKAQEVAEVGGIESCIKVLKDKGLKSKNTI